MEINKESSLLFLGNGASRDLNNKFDYDNLYDFAIKYQFLNEASKRIFEKVNSVNFEYVLERITETQKIFEIIPEDIIGDKLRNYLQNLEEVKNNIRAALIKVIKELCQYQEIREYLYNIGEFIKKFRWVMTTNYDPYIYWAMMINDNKEVLKDCFFHNINNMLGYDIDSCNNNVTQVFYLHGNIILAHKDGENLNTYKIKAQDEDLLDEINTLWGKGYTPVFVGEADSENKLNRIKNNDYLQELYYSKFPQILKECRQVYFYGFGFNKNDKHIGDVFKNYHKKIKEIFIDNYNTGEEFKTRYREFLGDYNCNKVQRFEFNKESVWKY